MNNNSPFLLNEYELSRWAFTYCKTIKDDPKIRKMITEQIFCYLYCKGVKDRPEIRNKITYSDIALEYCLKVKDRPSIRKLIVDDQDLYFYYSSKQKKKLVEWEKFHE